MTANLHDIKRIELDVKTCHKPVLTFYDDRNNFVNIFIEDDKLRQLADILERHFNKELV